jgi:hypothetical protein
VAGEVRREVERGIGRECRVEDSSRSTRGQLVEWPVEVQVAEKIQNPHASKSEVRPPHYTSPPDFQWEKLMDSRRCPAASREPLRAIWRGRFYDFNVYSRGKKREMLNYMHANPVKRGLVNRPRDWARSSWAYYFGGEKPLLPMDV